MSELEIGNAIELVKSNAREDLVPDLTIGFDSNLVMDLGYDSLRLMGLFFSLEQQFNIDIVNSSANYEFFGIETVGDLVDLLKKHNEYSC